MTGNGPALWLLVTSTAIGTGLVLWLLKLLIDEATSAIDAEPADEDGQAEEPRLTWVLASPDTGAPLHPAPGPAAPHAHTATCVGETLSLTTVQPSRARHAKPRTS